MNGKSVAIALGIMIALGVAGLAMLEPNRVDGSRAADSEKVAEELAAVEAIETNERERIERVQMAQADTEPKEPVASEDAEPFKVSFECSNGTFVIELYPEWAPLGVAHLKKIIEADVYNGAKFFRAVPGFVVQFGIPAEPEMSAKWSDAVIKDDPVTQSNTRGTVTYATGGPDSRSTQIFINLTDNSRLDDMGFAPIGKVVEGMDVVDDIYSGYGNTTTQKQHLIKQYGNKFLDEQYPNLDYIKDASIIAPAAE